MWPTYNWVKTHQFEPNPQVQMGTLTLNNQIGVKLGWQSESNYGDDSSLTPLLIVIGMPTEQEKRVKIKS